MIKQGFLHRRLTLLSGLRSRRAVKPYRLYALAAVSAVLAAVVWPFDRAVSDMFCISRVGHGTTYLWWEVLKGVEVFGKGDVLILLGFLLAIHRWKQVAVSACIALLLASLVVTPMKLLIGRPRPDESSNKSFPSGDIAALTAFLVPIASAFPVIRPVAFAGVATVGAVRVANGFHFPSDIFAGITIGIVAGCVVGSLKFFINPRARRLLRRSWLAAALGIIVLIALFLPGAGNVRMFLSIFGPAAALLAVAPFIRARLRTRSQADKRLLFWVICFLSAALLGISWLVVGLASRFGVKFPSLVMTDPSLVWSVIGMGCTLLALIYLGLREYGGGRYRSTAGILTASIVPFILIIITSVFFGTLTALLTFFRVKIF